MDVSSAGMAAKTGVLSVKKLDKALVAKCKRAAKDDGMLFYAWMERLLAQEMERRAAAKN